MPPTVLALYLSSPRRRPYARHDRSDDLANSVDQPNNIDPALQDEINGAHQPRQAHIPRGTQQPPPTRAPRVLHAVQQAENRSLAAKRRAHTQDTERASTGVTIDAERAAQDEEGQTNREDDRPELHNIGPKSIMWADGVGRARKDIMVNTLYIIRRKQSTSLDWRSPRREMARRHREYRHAHMP